MDSSYKNLQIQKKFLSNITSLQQKKQWDWTQMEFLRVRTKKLIKEIEKARFEVNNYNIVFDFLNVVESLGILVSRAAFQDYIDISTLIKMFGVESVGPTIEASYDGANATYYIVHYSNDGSVLRKEPYDS